MLMVVPAALLLAGVAWIPPLQPVDDEAAERACAKRCAEVLAEFQLLQREIVDIDTALFKGVETMHAAPTEQRLEAVEALVEDLVEDRAAERQSLKCAHQKLIGHLLDHMVGDPETLGSCPLMNAMRQEQRPGSGSPLAGPMEY
jgi:hypothetical protein